MKSKDPHAVEAPLKRQQAASLDPALIDRLEAAADRSLLELSAIERQLETKLSNIQPACLQPTLLDRLETMASKAGFPKKSPVLEFPGNKSVSQPRRRSGLAVAAAVALLGAISALMLDPGPAPLGASSEADPTPAPSLGPALPEIRPTQFSRDLSNAIDAGIVWKDDSQPHRVLKVVYTDRMTVEHEDGSSYEVETPRVEYILVPTESH